jgi:GNAT superfamily N-acetyltransferase
MNAVIRSAVEKDTPLILEFIRALAEYEDLLEQVEAGEEDLRQFLFRDHFAETLIAEWDNKPGGFALYFHNFSTFRGKPGIYIEDLFVKPEFRKKGLGKALFTRLGEIAAQRNCGRLEWACLDWNKPSIDFYLSRGGEPLSDWTTYRLNIVKDKKVE